MADEIAALIARLNLKEGTAAEHAALLQQLTDITHDSSDIKLAVFIVPCLPFLSFRVHVPFFFFLFFSGMQKKTPLPRPRHCI